MVENTIQDLLKEREESSDIVKLQHSFEMRDQMLWPQQPKSGNSFHLFRSFWGLENCWITEFEIHQLCAWPSNLGESHRTKVERSRKV